MCGQLVDDRPGEGTPAHIVQCGFVDDVVGVSGAQQIEEVQPALARPRAEPGEVVVADLRAEAILAGMARTGIVDRDPGRRLQASPQHLTAFSQEAVLTIDQQAHHLALGDADADRSQLRHQPLDCHLPLMVLQQHEAAQLRSEMPDNAGRQRCQHHMTVRRHPAFPAIADHLGVQHQVLHDVAARNP